MPCVSHVLLSDEFTRRKERLLAQTTGRVLDFADEATADGLYDSVVLVHVLCEARDVAATLERVDELLAPDGRVFLLEHTRGTGLRALTQDAWAPIYKHAPFGCTPNIDPLAALRGNGFAVTDCDRFKDGRRLPIVAPYVSAVAIRKAAPHTEEAANE